jgi:hypothetical protein
MSGSDLIQGLRPPHYPRALKIGVEPMGSLVHNVPVRPARFVVGMARSEKSLLPPLDQVTGTALSVAAFIGRVDEISNATQVTVTIWERPNGREGLTTLIIPIHFKGEAPAVGDILWIWTWDDVADSGRHEDRIHIEVESREIDEPVLARLRAVLEAADGDTAG